MVISYEAPNRWLWVHLLDSLATGFLGLMCFPGGFLSLNQFQSKGILSNELEKVHSQIMVCTLCDLYKSRTQAVPGDGPGNAQVMFVGEGPGQNEDKHGLPFVGAAGRLLDGLLESIDLKRSDVFITNIVKCRPPENRAPRKVEIETCNPYLQSQFRLIKPRIVCPLGTPAIMTVMRGKYAVTKVHGQPFRTHEFIILPLYHPAAALYDNRLQDVLFNDFKTLKKLVENGKLTENIPMLNLVLT